MKRPPRFTPALLLAAILGLSLASCKKRAADEEPKTLASVNLPGITELNAKQAAASFTENVQSKLDLIDLAKRATFALVKPATASTPEEIVYVFRNAADEKILQPELLKMGNKWQEIPPEDPWLPWEAVLGETNNFEGASMGTFKGNDFRMSLWIDRFATDLFITYKKHTDKPAKPMLRRGPRTPQPTPSAP